MIKINSANIGDKVTVSRPIKGVSGLIGRTGIISKIDPLNKQITVFFGKEIEIIFRGWQPQKIKSFTLKPSYLNKKKNASI